MTNINNKVNKYCFKHLTIRPLNKTPYGTYYQARLTSQLGRKTIGLGSDEISALVAAREIDEEIQKCFLINSPIDLQTLKDIALKHCNSTKKANLTLVQKDSLQALWMAYVEFHKSLGCWEESYLLTHIQSVSNLVSKCPHQKLEEKQSICQFFFSGNRSPKTSKERFKLLVTGIDWASKQGLIPRNWGIEYRDLLSSISVKVAKGKGYQGSEDSDIEVFTVNEVAAILEALKTDAYSRFKGKHSQYYPIVTFLWLTGCRPNEAIALKWKNVDLKAKKIIFCEGEVSVSGKVIKKRGTKTVYSRKFPINEELKSLLQGIPKNSEYVFLNDENKAISHQSLRRVFNLVLKALGLKERPLYQLRHSMISYHANNNFPLHKLAQLVGNSEKIIKEHYLRIDIEAINLPTIKNQVD